MATHPPAWAAALRANIPLLRDVTYLGTASHAPLSQTVQGAAQRGMEREATQGVLGKWGTRAVKNEAEAVRAQFAAFLGLTAAAIGWTANTTAAIRYAISSIAWQPGDVVLWSSAEHAGSRQLQAGLAQRRGVRNIVLPVEQGDAHFLNLLADALRRERAARLLFLSHVSCLDGRRLPVAEATRLAHARGVPVLVDGAQAVGQFPVDVAALGCDFYAGSGHKWLLGPHGLGFLAVSPERLPSFFPDFVMAPPDEAASSSLGWTAAGTAGRRMELGTSSIAPVMGLGASLTALERIGLHEIEGYVAGLSAQLRAGLDALPGIRTVTPPDAGASSGITTFTLPEPGEDAAQRVVLGMWESHRVVSKVQPEFPGIRVSLAAFNTSDDVARLLDALRAWLPSPA